MGETLALWIYPFAFRSSLGLRHRELLQTKGYIWQYIPPLVLIRIQYNTKYCNKYRTMVCWTPAFYDWQSIESFWKALPENLHYKILFNEKVWKKSWLKIAFLYWFLLAPCYYKNNQQTATKSFFTSLLQFHHYGKKYIPPYFFRENQLLPYSQPLCSDFKKVFRGSLSNRYIQWMNLTNRPGKHTQFHIFGNFQGVWK